MEQWTHLPGLHRLQVNLDNFFSDTEASQLAIGNALSAPHTPKHMYYACQYSNGSMQVKDHHGLIESYQ